MKRAPSERPGETTVIHSDPADPWADPFDGRFGAHDHRALAAGPSVAVFETAPFAKPVEIIGRVVVELAASASAPDFDLWAQLYDVAPDGTAWNLSTPGTALQRASYRDGGPERRLVKPGETVRLRMDRLVTANRFLEGHRLRVVITPRSRRSSRSTRRPARRSSERQRTRRGDPHRARGDRAAGVDTPTGPR